MMEHAEGRNKNHLISRAFFYVNQLLFGTREELEQIRNNDRVSVNMLNGSTKQNPKCVLDSTSQIFLSYAKQSKSKFRQIISNKICESNTIILETRLQEIDQKLDVLDLEELQKSLNSLQSLSQKFPNNLDILWRIGKACHNIAVGLTDTDQVKRHVENGLSACQKVLEINPNKYEAHKWYGLLVGYRTCFQSPKEKIAAGYVYKQHMDIALALNPNDATLYHMRGRFSFAAAELKWYMRKIAATFFAEPPTSTYDEALEYFHQAERISKAEWKENKLFIAKCQIALGKYKDAVESLLEANEFKDLNLNITIDPEISALLKKYKHYKQ